MTTSPILTLAGLKKHRETVFKGTTAKQVAALTGILEKRMFLIESRDAHKAEEPWLDETAKIAAVMRANIFTLLASGSTNLADIDAGTDLQDDVDVWRTGERLPLRYGIRLAVRFGLDDPFRLLSISALDRQFWSIALAGERTGGRCAWCAQAIVEDAGHLPTCTPSILYGPRDAHLSLIGSRPQTLKPHKRRGGSRLAPGLAPLRARLGFTQEQMGKSIGIEGTSYYRIEKMRDPLTQDLADKICALYKVSYLDLTSPPVPAGAV